MDELGDISNLIKSLRSERVTDLYYRTLPDNVKKLIRIPGITHQVMSSYSATVPDDLYRFNLVLIINNRLQKSPDEIRVNDWGEFLSLCLKDNSPWVRTEAANALRFIPYGAATPLLIDLLRHGDDANVGYEAAMTLMKYSDQSVFILIGEAGRNDVMEKLIAIGFDVNGIIGPGWRPLVFAAAEGRKNTVKMLLNFGADVNGTNKYGRTALMFASIYGYSDIVKILLESDADVNIKPDDDTGWTALIAAAQRGHVNVVKILIDAGADVTIRDKEGNTAQEMAKIEGHKEIVKILKAASKDKVGI